ncbi:hypothetical protein JKP88DRAFT_288681 [Tribonema minus]|uniref:Uncharacterized protein n=1 Tax=Tribonema minus TaxID=303371 RepID=A0A835Z2L9_9STRA|nr:hypothetical protein JKP88DRAFT_290704 [Tribonema minus]KAG5186600.1 hypothetical protein JKP88DRAFT_288681 [Tribonema minus]
MDSSTVQALTDPWCEPDVESSYQVRAEVPKRRIMKPAIPSMSSKTRTELNKEAKARAHSRKKKRVTEGLYTYDKAVAEAENNGFKVIEDEAAWDAQAPVRASMRKLRIMGRNPIHLHNIVSGAIRSDAPSEEEKAASYAKRSETMIDLDLGQRNWYERSATKAAQHILDPDGLVETAPLLDGLGGDLQMRLKVSENPLYAGCQVKSGTGGQGKRVDLNVKKKDGEKGGCYEGHILLGVVFTIADRDAALTEMNTFDAVPEVVVEQIFLYRSAVDLPCASLAPSPRRDKNDKYGDHLYVPGFDDNARLCRMREMYFRYVHERAVWGSEQLWFALGPGTPNTCVSTKHASEVLNIKALADLVGFQSLRAPERQNETVDVVWRLCDKDIRISVKTATIHGKGFQFELNKHPHDEHCDLVLAFYKDENNHRTDVSVISAARVYAKREVQVEHEKFSWSKTNNEDVLRNTVSLSESDAKESLIALVMRLKR